ncbi:MAG: GIY-YIG nuclease family protein [Candidatus Paceibacterota bacterium]|jgi:predicted GIY-YIG superfamily endonuclease
MASDKKKRQRRRGNKKGRRRRRRRRSSDNDSDSAAAMSPPPFILQDPAEREMAKTHSCYLLGTTASSGERLTYIGYTLDVGRRLRQHNGEIVGGAKYTRGHQWSVQCWVEGFTNNIEALRFEWAWKHATKSTKMKRAAALNRASPVRESIQRHISLLPPVHGGLNLRNRMQLLGLMVHHSHLWTRSILSIKPSR